MGLLCMWKDIVLLADSGMNLQTMLEVVEEFKYLGVWFDRKL